MKSFAILIALIFCLNSPVLAGELVLGTIFELQDSQAPTAQEALNGALLAVKKINESGTQNKIKLEVESVSGDPAAVISGVDRITKSKGIIAVAGLISENTALSAAPAFQAANLPFLCTGAQVDSLTHIGTNIFSLAVTDIRTGQLLAEFASSTMQLNNIMLVLSDLSDSTARQADTFRRRFKQNGGNIMAEMRITEPDPDLSFISEKLKELIPPENTNSTVVNDTVGVSDFVDSAVGITIQKRDAEPAKPQVEAVIVFAPARIAEKLLTRLKQDQLPYSILGGMTFDSVAMQQPMKDYPATVYYASQASMEREAPLVRSFVKSYKALFGSKPQTGYAALGFDSIMLLAAAGAERTSSAAVRDVLPETRDFEGVSGKITFLGRSATKPLYITQIRNGQKSLATVLE